MDCDTEFDWYSELRNLESTKMGFPIDAYWIAVSAN